MMTPDEEEAFTARVNLHAYYGEFARDIHRMAFLMERLEMFESERERRFERLIEGMGNVNEEKRRLRAVRRVA